MQLAEHAEGDLRPELERPGAAWMKPGRRFPRHREVALVDAESGKRRDCIGLGGEHVRLRRFAGPVTSGAGKHRTAEAHAGCCDVLILGQRTAIGLAKLEQRAVGKATVPVPLRRGDEAGQEAGSHLGKFGRDRIAQSEFSRAASEELCLIKWDERPGDGLDQPARGEHAAHAPRSRLHLGQHGARNACFTWHRHCRNLIHADEPHHLLDEIDRHGNVRAP
jgi:hypothetical protein